MAYSKLAAWCDFACLAVRLPAQTPAAPYCIEPAVAPNRAEIAFVSSGDIWTAPLGGGEAHLLVSHPAVESRPLYSPDGTRLAFVSDRTGGGDIYVLQLATGALKRITFDDGREQLDAWSRDGKWLYFSSTAQDVAGSNDIFRVSAEGGTPMPVSADRYVNQYFAAPSPAGDLVALTARGDTSGQWWRHGHAHIDESEIWLETPGGTPKDQPKYQLLHGGDFKSLGPCGAPMGRASTSSPTRAAPKTSGRSPCAAARRPARSRNSKTAGCCGRTSPTTARPSSSSVTSAFGSWTWPARRPRPSPSRCAARRRRRM
jgi:hypothetical protein